jgi:hypothetical protein
MKLVSAYAIGTLVICLISLITDAIGISRGGIIPEKMDIVSVLSIVQIFWVFVSVIALICFIGFKIPIRAPLVYSAYNVISLLVVIPLAISGVMKRNPQIMLDMFVFDLFVTLLIAFLNFGLWMYVRKDAARIKQEQDSWIPS